MLAPGEFPWQDAFKINLDFKTGVLKEGITSQQQRRVVEGMWTLE